MSETKKEETKEEAKAPTDPYQIKLAAALKSIELNHIQKTFVKQAGDEYKGYKVCVINCTLKRSPEVSHTDGIIKIATDIYKGLGCIVDEIRLVDYDIAFGVYPDMTKQAPAAWKKDDWPGLYKRIMAADILLLTSPVWLGMKSSVCNVAIERLYANSHIMNEKGQYAYYGKVGTVLVTGNEDGVKHCAIEMVYALQHLGYTIPPQADAGYLGMNIGPGPSLLDDPQKFLKNDFCQRNTTFMCFNALQAAKLLKQSGGYKKQGNSRADWDLIVKTASNPEHRT